MILTAHARQRIYWRALSLDDLAAALVGICVRMPSGETLFYDRKSRCAVIVRNDVVITCYRLKKKQIKLYSQFERVG